MNLKIQGDKIKVMGNFREKFYNLLGGMFVGDSDIEGQGGFINLLKIKRKYYENEFKPRLQEKIEEILKIYPNFESELFEKLYTFFSRYFSESGSIYFVNTPSYHQIYEKIYTDKEDVILFWKTRGLYYIKTDRIFKSLEIKIEENGKEYKFYFDASKLEYKKANEKREVIYELDEEKTTKEKIYFYVYYSEKGKTTKIDEILKKLKKKEIKIAEDILEKAFKRFEQQSEVDYFIHKNAKAFLTEQLKLYIYNYLFKEKQEWTKERLDQIYKFQEIAELIIDFVSKFEDELVKIWNKPRFVFNSNYVITLDRIVKQNKEKGFEIIEKILNHKNFNEQVKEWKELEIIDDDFDKNKIIQKTVTGKELNKKYQFLPIDTKYFKDLELEILGLFDDLDNALDGWLIKSENYQALNTILPKFKEKVQTIYIDPPYNTGNDGFLYRDRFQHSSWLTMMENRLELAKNLMNEDGVIFVSIDDRSQENLKIIMKEIFEGNFIAQLIRDIPDGTNLRTTGGIKTSTEYVLVFYKKSVPSVNNLLFKNETYQKIINKNINKNINDVIETRLTNRGNQTSEILFPAGIGKKTEGLNIYVKEGNFINPESKEKILVKKHDLIIKDGILQNDVVLEAPWRMPNVLKKLFNGEDVFDDSGQKYEYVFFNNKGVPYISKERSKTLIPSYLNIPNEKDSLFIDILGYSESPKEATIKPVNLIYLLVSFYAQKNSIIFDFFAGFGTTAHAVMKLNKEDGGKRKYILVEMANYFDTVIIPRIKKLCYSFNWKDGKPQDTDGISQFFKYYELEQYEEILRKAKYFEPKEQKTLFDKDFNYIFSTDSKMLDAIELDYENNKVKVDLTKIYPEKQIDIAETLSNLKGKWIKRISENEVELEGGEKIDIKNLDYRSIKNLIWW